MKKNLMKIVLKKVAVHNLKNVDLELSPGELILFTGVSGSGKSSMAFDTIFAEGQRRYIESLSTYARRYLGDIAKPDLEFVGGLSPTIAIEQKSAGKNPRSTVGTMTEVYDFIRVLYARIATPYCPITKEPVTSQSKERVIQKVQKLPLGNRLIFLAPFAKDKKGEFKDDFALLLKRGYMRVRVDGKIVDLTDDIALDKNLTHTIDVVIDRVVHTKENHSRMGEAVLNALEVGGGHFSILDDTTKEETLFSIHAYSAKANVYYPPLEPHDFSFNSPSGMCPTCLGLKETQTFDLDLVIDPNLSIMEDCCSIAGHFNTVRYSNIYRNLSELYNFDLDTPWKELSKKAQDVFLHGTKKKWIQMHFIHPQKKSSWTDYVQWRGVLFEAKKRYAEATSEGYRKKMEKLMSKQLCPTCLGSRLKPYPSEARFCGHKIEELTEKTIGELYIFFQNLNLDEEEHFIADELLKEVQRRLRFLNDVGLNYLSLDRTAPTLSGGEAQRVRLASQVGSGLVGVTYVLDEPSIGLHPRDNQKLITSLKTLRDAGNTVIVVEHDEETIWAADRVVDFGPGAGREGGEILLNGSMEELLAHPRSETGHYLSGKKSIQIPTTRRSFKECLTLVGASHNNLKHCTASFPLGLLVAVTGVSGSGKSSLISNTLFPALANRLHNGEHPVGTHEKIEGIDKIDKVIAIDQSPIGKNPRSNPSTYIKIFDDVRQLFAKLPESSARGYLPGRFSFNVEEGACPRCSGMGRVRIDMDFLEDQWIRCPNCRGKRFDPETLSITYKGKNIDDVLQMTVEEALEFFINIPTLKRKLELLAKVGMGYMTLGQSSTTLSGGEAQRIKLAKELVRPSTGHTFYILDEPTTGLHFHDIKALLHVINELVDRGNTVLVIEHNMDVVKTADWVIDLGPEAGEGGGEIVATGTPEQIIEHSSPTATAIKHALHPVPHTTHTQEKKYLSADTIHLYGGKQNNLKHVDLQIPRGKLTVCCGPSGSGKSSLAFETVYAEGQRRYIESLSAYARQFVKQMPKPKLSQIEGLSPAIAIEQKQSSGNPRSTVGTQTEIYDYLRLLFSSFGTAYCPETGERIERITPQTVVDQILTYPVGEKITLLAPIELSKSEQFEEVASRFKRLGFLRLRLGETIYDLDEKIPFDRKRKNEIALVIDRTKVSPKNTSRLFEAVENCAKYGNEKVIVAKEGGETTFNLAFAVRKTGKSYKEITPKSLSFNSAEGMCPDCQGLGYQYGANLMQNEEVMDLSTRGLFYLIWSYDRIPPFEAFLKKRGIDMDTPLCKLTSSQLNLLMNGSDEPIQTKKGFTLTWIGIQPILARAGKSGHPAIRAPLIPLLDEIACISCLGSRLNPLSRNVRIEGHSISSLCQIPLAKTLPFLQSLKTPPLLEEVVKQLQERLQFLIDVGLHYLALDRRAPTLSNGEAQRIRLARQLGSQLTGVLYVLDEPTIGLHPHDNERLNQSLQKLKELGNTLLMVEHDPLTLKTADHLIDFGPGAGILGGEVTAQGSYEEVCADENSLTGAYLSGRKTLPIPPKRRQPKGFLSIENATTHNLKNLSVKIPTGILTSLTGVSGSGKSTLMHDVIKKQASGFDKLIVIDQAPIGHTVRADVGTYTDLLTSLRTFYSNLGSARAKGFKPRHFSTNHRKGMCTNCQGLGYKKVEMLFLPAVRIQCDQCQGLRLNPQSLLITYNDLNFGQLLQLTVEEARTLFYMIPKTCKILDTLISVGLGYLKIGQEIASLSGGEAQRIKLSRELSKRSSKNTLYLLDEPTTGLHPSDIALLLTLLQKLVDRGSTILLIEHNTDLIAASDYIIDLGPGAGDEGGEIVAMGTPEEIASNPHSKTGKYL
ncbi:MAG: UvrABC system protein A [Chlamydiales bacterium]|nr:UvrABC system protein A [Chlamydiales bacterium]MCH9619143.1 UvrABC system protein A [Chlamydiales bacterium]MCH9622405.1 UvrABC system protein A [Chlamydiales bacterium]